VKRYYTFKPYPEEHIELLRRTGAPLSAELCEAANGLAARADSEEGADVAQLGLCVLAFAVSKPGRRLFLPVVAEVLAEMMAAMQVAGFEELAGAAAAGHERAQQLVEKVRADPDLSTRLHRLGAEGIYE
jgi:hypothetical protein